MTQMKILRIREFVIAGTVATSLWLVIPIVFGQPTDRDWQRVERQVERLTESQGVDAIALEKRLSSIEGNQRDLSHNQREMSQKMDDAKRLALGALAVLVGLAIQSFWGLIVSKQKFNPNNKE